MVPFEGPGKHSFRAKNSGALQKLLAVVIGLAAAGVLIGLASCSGGDNKTVQREVALESATFPGPHPWTSNLTSVALPTEAATGAPPAGQAGSPVTVSGEQPELYGGVTGAPAMDRDRLVTELNGDPKMAAAWRGATGAPDVDGYVGGLSPVVLIHDTAVTDWDYENGSATPHQSVLQAGTPVLIDDRGVPRVRGTSGSPLGEPERDFTPQYTGSAWTTFSNKSVVAVQPAQQPAKTVHLLAVVPQGQPAANPFQPDIEIGQTTPVQSTRTAPPPAAGALPLGPLTPVQPRPAGNKPTGIQPTGAQPTGVPRPTGPRPTGLQPTGVPQPTGAIPPSGRPGLTPGPQPSGGPRPTGAQPTAVQPTGVQPSGVPRPTGVPQPTGAIPPSGRPGPPPGPQPSPGPRPTGLPQPTGAIPPSGRPDPSPGPQPSPGPRPTGAPQPTGLPRPTGVPQPTAVPQPSPAPRPTSTPQGPIVR
jgi:hypothetical protein